METIDPTIDLSRIVSGDERTLWAARISDEAIGRKRRRIKAGQIANLIFGIVMILWLGFVGGTYLFGIGQTTFTHFIIAVLIGLNGKMALIRAIWPVRRLPIERMYVVTDKRVVALTDSYLTTGEISIGDIDLFVDARSEAILLREGQRRFDKNVFRLQLADRLALGKDALERVLRQPSLAAPKT